MKNILISVFPFLSRYTKDSSPLRKKVAGGFVWAFVSKSLFAVFGVILNVLLVRLLSPEEVGQYFLAMSFIAILGTVTFFGLKQAIVKIIAESLAIGQPGRAGRAIQLGGILTGVGVLIGCLFFVTGGGKWIGTWLFDSPAIGELSLLLALWLLVSNFQTLIGEIFRGLQQLRWASLFGDQGTLTRLLTVFFLTIIWYVFSKSTLHQIVTLAVLSNAITLVLSLAILWPAVRLLDKSQGTLSSWELYSFTLPLWVNSLGLLIFNQADTIFLGIFRPEHEIALYGVAIRLALVVSMPQLMMNTVLPPLVADLYAKGQKGHLERMLRSTATISILLALVIFLLFIIFGKAALAMLFGSYYIQAYGLLLILSFGQLVNVATGSCGILMMMCGFHKQFMRITISTGILGLVILYFFIQLWGVFGSVLGVTINTIILMLWTMLYSWRKTGVRSWPYFVINNSGLLETDR